jgi:hypothetical protein
LEIIRIIPPSNSHTISKEMPLIVFPYLIALADACIMLCSGGIFIFLEFNGKAFSISP